MSRSDSIDILPIEVHAIVTTGKIRHDRQAGFFQHYLHRCIRPGPS